MMSFMKGAMLMLLLAAVSTNADPDHCGGLNKTMPGEDMHKFVGDWVLVWATSDSQVISVENLTSSHIQMHLPPDNSTMIYHERNRFRDGSCTTYNASFSIVPDLHKLDLVFMSEEKDGVVAPFNDTATAQFFETCPDCVSMIYRGNFGQFLLIYRREGHHQDLQKIEEAHTEFQKLSECLELPLERVFIYKGHEDFCHKTPQPGDLEVDAVEAGDA